MIQLKTTYKDINKNLKKYKKNITKWKKKRYGWKIILKHLKFNQKELRN